MRDIEKFDLGHLLSRAEQKYFLETLLGLSEADLTKFLFLMAQGEDWISLRRFTAKVIHLRNTRNGNRTLEPIDVFISFLDSCPSKEVRLENIASPFFLLYAFAPKCPQVILRISD